MASEIRVNRLSNRSGLSTITFANGGVQFSGITTFANGDFRVGTGATILNPTANEMQFHTAGSTRLTINNSGANLGTGSLTAVDATFTGNVSIGKTLTYEDVKNVDSVGVVTARTGVKITGGDFTVGTAITASSVTGNVTNDVGITTYSGSAVWFKGATANKDMYWSHASGATVYKDNAQILMGDGSDLQLKHDGTNSIITNNTGDLNVITAANQRFNTTGNFIVNVKGGNEDGLKVITDGACELYHNNSKKLETTSTGATVTSDLILNHASGDKALRWATGGTNKWSLYHNNGAGALVAFDNANNAERLRIDSSGSVRIGNTTQTFLSAADDLAIGNGNGSTGMTIYSGSSDGGFLAFADGTSDPAYRMGQIIYDHSGNEMLFRTNGNTNRLIIKSDGKISTGGLSAPTSDVHVWKSNAGGDVSLRVQNDTGTDSGTTASIYLTTSPTDNFNTCYIKASRATGDTTIGYGTQTASLTLLAEGDVMVNRTLYGGNGGRRNWFDNGAMNVIQRYQNCHAAGNYHSYGWAIDRFQNRGGNSQWGRSTNVPSGKGFDYSLKVGSGTGGSICQGIELTNQGKPGPFRVGTFWCVSVWSTQPVNQASNNGFCQDLGSTNYIALTARGPSGSQYNESGESVSGTASGTYKRYYKVWEVTSAPHSNNHTLNFGWAINYSGSGTSEWTGFQVEQVANADCKPSAYEHVDYSTDLRRCQRYAYRSTACRYTGGYKRHDNQCTFEIQSPVPMTSYTTSNGGGNPIGASSWDYGMLTNFQGSLQNPAATAIAVSEYDHSNGYFIMVLTTGYTGCTHCWIPSWESAQFEVACGPF